MPGFVGRDEELEAAAEFFDRLPGGPAALVFAGEPGIGKTALWKESLRRARERSLVVLAAQPSETESKLAFAALSDLLEQVADDIVPKLPEPQRRALAVVLLREDPAGRRPDQRALGTATIAVLTALAQTAPVVVAVDDLQWLDRASARVLSFAVRRLGRLPVGLLACERTGLGQGPWPQVEPELPEGQLRRLVLGPLGDTVLPQVVQMRLGRTLSRRDLGRIRHLAGGNPLFAVEIARSLPDDSARGLAVLPVPEKLRGLLGAPIAALPERARQALLPAAMLRHPPSVELVAAGLGRTAAGSRQLLQQAAAAGIVELGASRVRFTHPLFAVAVYSSACPRDRRRVHRRLAAVLDDTEDRAWHLALAAERPDTALTRALDAAAQHAYARGAAERAVELTEQALRLTPAARAAELQRRMLRVAEYRFHVGELQSARELIAALLELSPAARVHADALRVLGEIACYERSLPDGADLFRQALEHAGHDPALTSALELDLTCAARAAGDWTGAEWHAHRALTLAEPSGDGGRLAEALAESAIMDYLQGRGLSAARLNRALELEDGKRQTPAESRPSLIAGQLMLYEGQLELACLLLGQLRQRILDCGEESDLPYPSASLAWAECWRGHLGRAAFYADEALETASRIGDPARCRALACAAISSAYAGDAEATRRRASEALALGAATGCQITSTWARWALAVLAHSLRRPAAAELALAPLTAQVEREGVTEPARAVFLAEAIEALVALGQLDRAQRLTAMLEQAAMRLHRGWALAQAGRCRALLLAARGDLVGASRAASAALRHAGRLELRLELARTLLIAGEIERRSKRKRSARELLEDARQIFEEAGARMWAQRTRAELDRVTARRTGSQLTDSEKHVAYLAASGLTNRQVAAQLFMSPKTVEANLARAYRKLGIHSRAELGARLGGTEWQPAQGR
ncbi:MAG TPA: AAA family ATPase [Streptosporangiaceae bacterium]|nr:AAA family ATPase [Streptosporangiaceae bacterium]